MTNAEAVNWLINLTADIGKIEHQELWHYEQALTEIREMLETEPQRMRGKWKGYNGEKPDWQRTDGSPVFLICSECGATVVNNFAAKWNYCCVCGAEMGEQNET